MSMRFRYKLIQTGRFIHSLGGRTVRPRPLVPFTLIGSGGTLVRKALLDTGADDTVFPEYWAALVGLDLTNAPSGSGSVPGMTTVPLRYADVLLRLTDGREYREWPATVGFTPALLVYPLLGFAGCLQFFTSLFRGDREEVELTVNALYPGT